MAGLNPNLSGVLNLFRLLYKPSLCVPHHSCPTFNDIPFSASAGGLVEIEDESGSRDRKQGRIIRAIVLDKDNCFAAPNHNTVYPAYQDTFDRLRKAYPDGRLVIVSNTAGTSFDRDGSQAAALERNTGVPVLRHSTKKPGCHPDIVNYFRHSAGVDLASPAEIAVIGDRLFTDAMTANLMGANAIWISQGVVPSSSMFARFERSLEAFLQRNNIGPPKPRSQFE